MLKKGNVVQVSEKIYKAAEEAVKNLQKSILQKFMIRLSTTAGG